MTRRGDTRTIDHLLILTVILRLQIAKVHLGNNVKRKTLVYNPVCPGRRLRFFVGIQRGECPYLLIKAKLKVSLRTSESKADESYTYNLFVKWLIHSTKTHQQNIRLEKRITNPKDAFTSKINAFYSRKTTLEY